MFVYLSGRYAEGESRYNLSDGILRKAAGVSGSLIFFFSFLYYATEKYKPYLFSFDYEYFTLLDHVLTTKMSMLGGLLLERLFILDERSD